MSGHHFKLKPKVLSEEEKLSRYKSKLETLVERQESRATALTKQVLQSHLLSEKALTVEEMKEMMEEVGSNLACDRETERSAGRNLRNTELVGQLEMTACQGVLEEVRGDRASKGLLVKTVPHTDFPHVLLQMIMLTEEDTMTQGGLMPTIKRLEATLEGIETDRNLQEAISYCEKAVEPQLLTELVREYLPLYQQRKDILDSADSEFCNIKSVNVVEFFNSAGTHLASVILRIKLSLARLAFSPTWQCKLTEEGEAACSRLNLPSQLAATGSIQDWDWSQAVDTLTKVARFDEEQEEDTPNKEFDASKVNTDTPICGARKSLTKRKL